jgi:probable HAF family extracellular repeat protein
MKLLPFVTGALIASATVSISFAQMTLIPAYDLIEIPSLPGDQAEATGINNKGQVSGWSMTGVGCCARAFKFSGNQPDFAPANAPISYSHGINSRGMLVANIDISGGGGRYQAARGFPSELTQDNPSTKLPLPNAAIASWGLAINKWGHVVGSDVYSSPLNHTRAFLYTTAHIDLGLPAGHDTTYPLQTWAVSVNDADEVVGWNDEDRNVADANGNDWFAYRALYWNKNSGMTDLNDHVSFLIPNQSSYTLRKAHAINSHSAIVGYGSSLLPNTTHAFRLQRDRSTSALRYKYTDLGTFLNGGISYALALNSGEPSVGAAYLDGTGVGNFRAALFTHGRVINLNDRLSETDRTSWTLRKATGINDNGEIVGWGEHGDVERAFVLRPRAQIIASSGPRRGELTVSGSGFAPKAKVTLEARLSDIGAARVRSPAVVWASPTGTFSWSAVVPCVRGLVVNAWDQKTSAHSNARRLDIECPRRSG